MARVEYPLAYKNPFTYNHANIYIYIHIYIYTFSFNINLLSDFPLHSAFFLGHLLDSVGWNKTGGEVPTCQPRPEWSLPHFQGPGSWEVGRGGRRRLRGFGNLWKCNGQTLHGTGMNIPPKAPMGLVYCISTYILNHKFKPILQASDVGLVEHACKFTTSYVIQFFQVQKSF